MSAQLLRARPARVVPSVIVAVVLLLIAVALGWAGIAAIAQAGSADASLETVLPGIAGAESLQWSTPAVIAAGIVLGLIGLVLVILAISPGARRILGLQAPAAEHVERLEVAMPTSALSDLAASAADSVDGVARVRASSNTRSSIVTFTTPVRDTAEIRGEVADSVTRRLSSIDFVRQPSVRVHAVRRQ